MTLQNCPEVTFSAPGVFEATLALTRHSPAIHWCFGAVGVTSGIEPVSDFADGAFAFGFGASSYSIRGSGGDLKSKESGFRTARKYLKHIEYKKMQLK